MKAIVVFLLGFTLSGVWIALNTFLYGALNKKIKNFWVTSPAISGAIPALIIYLIVKDHPFHFDKLGALSVWGIAVAAVIVSSIIVIITRDKTKKISGEELKLQCLAGALMEVPQRAMMMPFVIMLLEKRGLNTIWSVVITALVWLAGMIFQSVLMNKNFSGKTVVSEMIPALIFSLGIGYAFYATGCILVPIVFHALERILSNAGNVGKVQVEEKEEAKAA
ncbi:hypothetical protein SAMN02910339_02929 [Lachnospiraceae bacterium YSD2013]|nr:hypothetical protein SAMN02910339_02929 [Lachnospiraceae bacterium YSD2013]